MQLVRNAGVVAHAPYGIPLTFHITPETGIDIIAYNSVLNIQLCIVKIEMAQWYEFMYSQFGVKA